MFILGLQGSPRKKGNSARLLSVFLEEAERYGAKTLVLDIPRMKISPCRECGNCERKGFCPIDDDMQKIYSLLRQAELVVFASPVFFYGVTAQLKAPIDRSQTLWSRKYIHQLTDPGQGSRRGVFLSVGATKGKDLFEGIGLTAKYFYDAVGASFEGGLTYHKVENPGDIETHATALSDARERAGSLVSPYMKRKKVLFLCTENACRSEMAAAFARYHGGDRFAVGSGGSAPADAVNPLMVEAMGEKGIDMAYPTPQSIDDAISRLGDPDLITTMGCQDACPMVPGARNMEWDLPDPAGQSIEFMRGVRDDIEKRVRRMVES